MISDLTERLHFFFSNANLRQDKWMRNEMKQNGCITLEQLLKFHTIKSISTDKVLLAQAATALKDELTYDEEKEEHSSARISKNRFVSSIVLHIDVVEDASKHMKQH